MNLIIDQGNSVCKVAIALGDTFVAHYSFTQVSLREAEELLARHPEVDAAIYSTVTRVDGSLISFLSERLATVKVVDEQIALPLEVRYDRSRLGSDRLAAVLGATCLASRPASLLVIDLGTAITFEEVDAAGIYLGGNISPGIYTRLKALNHFTSRLPLLHDLEPTEDLPVGTTTTEAISIGVRQGVIYEILGYIEQLRSRDPQAETFVTGGDAHLIQQQLPAHVRIEPDLVLYGLNKILEYNK